MYQRVFDSTLVKSGMFRASREEELLVLTSPTWPRALLISLESSTTDPKGDKPTLRSPSANRETFFARLYGEADAPLYGGDDSLVCRLQQTEGMAALAAALDARPKRSVPRADEPPHAVASFPPSAPGPSTAAPPPTAPLPMVLQRPSQPSANASTLRAAAPPPPAAALSGSASSGGRRRKPIPSMTTPAQNGGFAAGLELRVHDQNVADGTIADNEAAQQKRQKIVEKDERQRLGDGDKPGKRGGGEQHGTPSARVWSASVGLICLCVPCRA